jgi:hypothetical protein
MLTAVEVTREETPVLFVSARDELPEIRRAWEELESVVTLRGRRFVGVVWPAGVYWAAVERLAGEESGGLEAVARDADRPGLEYYRRHDEVHLLVPVGG